MSAGQVVNVVELVAGSELVSGVSAGASSITVEDPTDFNPEGGDLKLGTEEKSYSVVNEDTGVITLDSTLANAYSAEDRVTAMPEYVERFAFVQLEEQDETLQARVPHALYDRLVVGTRDVNLDEGELVEVERDPGGELIVADVIDREPLVDGGFLDPGSTIPPEAMTDGLAPATSPTPQVFGGVLSLFVSWLAVANADPVTYEVHVSTSSGFTPSGGTLAGEARGTLFVIRHLPGTTDPPAYGTTYFVKVIAKDADGAAAASAEDSATPEEGMQSAIIADLIAANSILAEHLQAVLVLGSTIVAGALGAGRVEMGIASDESGRIGIQAFGDDGTTVTFLVDAETGEVFLRGNVEFGQGSSLQTQDIIELQEQPTGSFETPIIRQTTAGKTPVGQASSVSATWAQPTLVGSTLIAVVTFLDNIDGVPPTPTTPSGWTLITSSSQVNGAFAFRAYKIEAAASRSGVQALTLGDTCHAVFQMIELVGVGVQDITFTATTSTTGGGSISSGTSGTPTQADEIVLAGIANSGTVGVSTQGDTDPPTGISPSDFALVRQDATPINPAKPNVISSVFAKTVSSIATHSISGTLTGAEVWAAWVVTFKAKPVGVETPPANKLRLYAKEVASVARPHVTNEAGLESAVVLGKRDEVWRMEYVEVTRDFANIPAHTGGSYNETIPGLAVGDICVIIGTDGAAGAQMRPIILKTRAICTSAGIIGIDYANADSADSNPASCKLQFLVIHKS